MGEEWGKNEVECVRMLAKTFNQAAQYTWRTRTHSPLYYGLCIRTQATSSHRRNLECYFNMTNIGRWTGKQLAGSSIVLARLNEDVRRQKGSTSSKFIQRRGMRKQILKSAEFICKSWNRYHEHRTRWVKKKKRNRKGGNKKAETTGTRETNGIKPRSKAAKSKLAERDPYFPNIPITRPPVIQTRRRNE